MVEHQPDVIAAADWVVELGPGGGPRADGCCTKVHRPGWPGGGPGPVRCPGARVAVAPRIRIAVAGATLAPGHRTGPGPPPGHPGRRPAVQQPPAVRPAARTEVDDPVGRGDDVRLVLDDDDGAARLRESVEHGDERVEVGRVQPGRRLVEHDEVARLRPARAPARAGTRCASPPDRRRRRLAEREVAETDLRRARRASGVALVGEEHLARVVDGELEHVGDRELRRPVGTGSSDLGV